MSARSTDTRLRAAQRAGDSARAEREALRSGQLPTRVELVQQWDEAAQRWVTREVVVQVVPL